MLTICGSPEIEYFEKSSKYPQTGLHLTSPLLSFLFKNISYLILQGEYDIVLHNGGYAIVIEVKYKVHPDDVLDFVNRKLVNFKPLFPEYASKKTLGAVAGMSVPTESYRLAAKHGLLVLTQSGENLSVMNPEGFRWKEF